MAAAIVGATGRPDSRLKQPVAATSRRDDRDSVGGATIVSWKHTTLLQTNTACDHWIVGKWFVLFWMCDVVALTQYCKLVSFFLHFI